MNHVRYMVNRQPLASVLAVIVLVFVVMFGLFALSASVLAAQSQAQAIAMGLTGILVLAVLVRSGAGAAAGISVPPGDWARHWWVVTLLMAVLVLTTLVFAQVNVAALVFTPGRLAEWLLQNLATGLLEEVWFRGACFYLLYRAWGSTRSGLFKAAATQAVLFGALHLGNLHRSDLVYVLYQSTCATCIGFGFAGLVAYSRSIWPAVWIHGSINAANSADNVFAGSAYSFPESSTDTMLVTVGLFFLCGILPGVWCLRRAPLAVMPSDHPTPGAQRRRVSV